MLILVSLYMLCLGVLHYNSLCALNLHSTFVHQWVPFSSGVSQNKRTSAYQNNELNLILHISQTGT